MTYEITGTGYRMHDQLTRREAETLAATLRPICWGRDLDAADGTWYAIIQEEESNE